MQDIFKLIYEQGVPIEEMYRVFNMGIGFVVICKAEEADEIMKFLNNYFNCYKIGQVIDEEKITVETFEGKIIEY